MSSNAFRTEKHLQEYLVQVDLTVGRPYVDVRVKREQPVRARIPDLLYVGFVSKPEVDVWPSKWTFQHAHVVWQLRRRQRLRPQTIANRLYQSVGRVTKHLGELEASGAVKRLSTGSYTLAESLAHTAAEIVAVEVKLQNWRQALEQARCYSSFADRVIVAMDGSRVDLGLEQQEQFAQHRVGLCTVWRHRIEWLVHPGLQRPTLGEEREYLIAAADSSRHSWAAL